MAGSHERPEFDPEIARRVLDAVKHDVNLVDQQATALYGTTEARVADAARSLKSIGLFPKQRVAIGPSDSRTFMEEELLAIGPPLQTGLLGLSQAFLHPDGSIGYHHVVSLDYDTGEMTVTSGFSHLNPSARFQRGRQALTIIEDLLAGALKNHQSGENRVSEAITHRHLQDVPLGGRVPQEESL